MHPDNGHKKTVAEALISAIEYEKTAHKCGGSPRDTYALFCVHNTETEEK